MKRPRISGKLVRQTKPRFTLQYPQPKPKLGDWVLLILLGLGAAALVFFCTS